jgi:hypothetical protein
MKNQVKNFGQFINEGRRSYTQHEAQIDIEMGLGQTLGELADFLSHLAEIAPSCTVMDIEADDFDQNPNAGVVLTVVGDSYEISQLELFNQENGGDLTRRFYVEDHPDDIGTVGRQGMDQVDDESEY